MATFVTIGRIGRAHGIRGEVSIDLRTDEPERRFVPGSSVLLAAAGSVAESPQRSMTIESSRPHSGRMLVAFAEVDDRTAAEALTGTLLQVEVDASERPDDSEEFYDHQLIGLHAHAADGTLVGIVQEVLHLPGQDSLSIATDDGAEILVPFVSALVPEIDLDHQRIMVADVPGLLRLDEAVVDRDETGSAVTAED